MNWLIAHLVGDFLFQNDGTALRKKENTPICLWHTFVYTSIFYAFCVFGMLNMAWWQLALIAAQHFAIDRTNFVEWFVRWKGSARFAEPPLWPWGLIAIDQILHIAWLYIVIELASKL